jgi:hypothetical protein
MVSRLVAARSQSDIAADVAAVLKPMFVSDREHERDSREGADPGHLYQGLRFGEGLLRHLLDLLIKEFNLCTDLRDLINSRLQGWL